MPALFIDDAPVTLSVTPAQWGQILDILDGHTDARGLLLASVKFDGVEMPTFRDPALAARAMHGVQRVDVHTATAADLVDDCLREAARAATDLAGQASAAAALLRENELAGGNQVLALLGTRLHEFVSFMSALANHPGVDPARLSLDGVGVNEQLDRLEGWLGALVAAQGDGDWVTVADVLEFDCQPALAGWADDLLQSASREGSLA